MNRYNRQTILPEVGNAGQAAIRRAHVLVVGAGGLGAPVLQYLVGAGVGQVTIVDDDFVSLSNLHRQTLFREDDIGQDKVAVAAATLRRLNADCEIVTVTEALSPVNVQRLVAPCNLVLDCADSFAASYILSDKCFGNSTPLISASSLGFSGYVGGFCATAPSLRAVFPDLPERTQTCATGGVLGPVVGLIGAAQAQMALGHLIGQSPSPLGQLISFDMQSYRTGGFRFDGAPEPKTCLGFIVASDINKSDFVVELRNNIEAPVRVADIAQRMTVAQFKQESITPNVAQRAVFACRSGLRAWQAASHLRSYWTGEISLIAMGEMPDKVKLTTEN